MRSDFLAVDWGTTNRRVFYLQKGVLQAVERDPLGVRHMGSRDYESEVRQLRLKLGDAPMLLAGMVGSTIGWKNAEYVAAPAGLGDIARALLWGDSRTAIVPGLSIQTAGRADVMRGEEIHFLGADALVRLEHGDLLCQPGTHNKWAQIEHGRIVDFITVMTGEIFDLLRTHSILSHNLGGKVRASDAFLQGVKEGAGQDILASLFAVRARSVLGLTQQGDAADFASGLLIGADVAKRIEPGKRVHVIAGHTMGGLYAAAIQALGGEVLFLDCDAAFIAGISALADLVW